MDAPNLTVERIELEALLTERAGMDAENEGRARRGESPAYGSDHYYELAERIRALKAASLAGQPAAPAKPRVSREWVRFQAGEIWSADTLDDAVDTLSDTLRGFGVEVEGE